MDDLLQEFIGETREMLGAIASEIVAWEADPADRARLDEIFRFVHTVKGSCGFLDLPRLARLSHAAEDVLGDLRAGRRQPDAALVSAVLGIVDRIGELTEAIGTGDSLPDEADHRLIAALHGPAGDTPAPAPAMREPAARAVARTVRLPVDLLDRMMAGVSDMVLARNELARKLREGADGGATNLAFDRLSTCVAEMRDAIMRTRMQRIDHVFATLPRMVRDLAAELGKLATIEIEGGDVELDREMIEMIRDPLTHIIRNAIDHGIEQPEVRRQAGKPPAGRLVVTARQAGNQIAIEVIDDGRGIDGNRVAQRAVSAGLIAPDRVARLSWAQKVELVFEPGLSTAEAVTTISGRGVGMDVVRANVERIGGHVDIDSRPSLGLRVAMRVPLTLTIIPAFTVTAGTHRFAVPRAAIDEIVRVRDAQVTIDRLGDAEMATIRGRRLPLVRLSAVLGGEDGAGAAILMVLHPAGGARYALALDGVHDHEELVIKPAAPAIMVAGIYAGTTLPDSGRPMLLLDPAGIAAVARVPAIPAEVPIAPAATEPTEPTLLFTDLDGAVRAVRLDAVERIDEVAADAIITAGGRLRLVQDGRMVPLIAADPAAVAGRTTVLRLAAGPARIGYAVRGVNDILDLPVHSVPPAHTGRIAGVLLVDGRPVELLSPDWLFAEADQTAVPRAIMPSDMPEAVTLEALRALMEAAGYRVTPAAAEAAPALAAPVVQLRPDAAPDLDCYASVTTLRPPREGAR